MRRGQAEGWGVVKDLTMAIATSSPGKPRANWGPAKQSFHKGGKSARYLFNNPAIRAGMWPRLPWHLQLCSTGAEVQMVAA